MNKIVSIWGVGGPFETMIFHGSNSLFHHFCNFSQ